MVTLVFAVHEIPMTSAKSPLSCTLALASLYQEFIGEGGVMDRCCACCLLKGPCTLLVLTLLRKLLIFLQSLGSQVCASLLNQGHRTRAGSLLWIPSHFLFQC